MKQNEGGKCSALGRSLSEQMSQAMAIALTCLILRKNQLSDDGHFSRDALTILQRCFILLACNQFLSFFLPLSPSCPPSFPPSLPPSLLPSFLPPFFIIVIYLFLFIYKHSQDPFPRSLTFFRDCWMKQLSKNLQRDISQSRCGCFWFSWFLSYSIPIRFLLLIFISSTDPRLISDHFCRTALPCRTLIVRFVISLSISRRVCYHCVLGATRPFVECGAAMSMPCPFNTTKYFLFCSFFFFFCTFKQIQEKRRNWNDNMKSEKSEKRR